jgi:propionyl-CoA carboxylase alpha chain
MIKISAGHKLDFSQKDVKINGHSIEYRVYAEDPARKFLPSIGFLKRYIEPRHHENVRIDTGVEEGSEISMYYDPMISKLITWAETRDEALKLMNVALDEYVIRGVTHNNGFGESICNNPDFMAAEYTTNFIPKWYPDGFKGEEMNLEDKLLLSVLGAKMKNIHRSYDAIVGSTYVPQDRDLYALFEDKHYKVSQLSDTEFDIVELESGKAYHKKLNSFNLVQDAIIYSRMGGKSEDDIVQFFGTPDCDLTFEFWHKGTKVAVKVLTAEEYKYESFMPPPVVLDFSKSVLSPMPGAIVSVSVEKGDKVVEGQEVLVIEAMKMQNIIKSEIEGVVKNVKVVAGDSVGVDALLIEFV